VPRVGEHEGADYAREVQRTGARELEHLVVGIVVGPSYMCARLLSAWWRVWAANNVAAQLGPHGPEVAKAEVFSPWR
jgi:hypothetical protein